MQEIPAGRRSDGLVRRLSFRPDRVVPGTRRVARARACRRGARAMSESAVRAQVRAVRRRSMASTRLRLVSLFAVAAIAAGACNATASPGASTAAGNDCTAGTGSGNLQVPDVVAGKFNVAMVLIGPHDDGGWSQAHYEGLQ